ncbi:enoyl-CoA hydratase/isomerase family protein [Nitrogeniibacter aestuarii]|uniref:enoyl-CoA hydratase/isomerase family protein n=1 Tax=Nitrogeniibacter aestuarii TaxID=2815343 RepID=UPI001D110F77|nr:enoyl-CoA hydratase-related protein [Nitrogeniibacter aestuarii]
MPGQVLLTIDEHIATITLSNPGKLNAVDSVMWQALRAHMKDIAERDDVRCVILRGEGDDAFAAGGDIEEFLSVRATVDDALHYHEAWVATALDAIRECPVPTIAAIRGACVGGGLEIAGCCDLRIAGESSRFGAPINKLGFSMYPREMAGLLEVVGPAVLLEILLEGRILPASEALAKGLLTRLVADESVMDEASAAAKRISAGAPLVARWHKHWVHRLAHDTPLSNHEKRAAFAFLDTEDYREGMQAFFEKRKPRFKGK